MRIKLVRYIGRQRTYSPEMRSEQHNYVTHNSSAIHKNSHAVSYCLMAFRCLFLKAHFAPEWWASVMSGCHPDKLVRYMSVARAEGWEPTDITRLGKVDCPDSIKTVNFDTLNINDLTPNFTVTDNSVNQGLMGIKGIGKNAAKDFAGTMDKFADIDDFIEQKGGKNKKVMERLIKLGAFKYIPGHENSRGLWMYYQYKYCTGKEITQLRKDVRKSLIEQEGWTEKKITEERRRQTIEYKKMYPKRTKIPNKIKNWSPTPHDSVYKVSSLFDDFTLVDILSFEKEYLGYYLHSPLDLYDIQGNCTIDKAKEKSSKGERDIRLEVVVTQDREIAITKGGNNYARLRVSDGVQEALVLIWNNELKMQQKPRLEAGAGISMHVEYDESRGTFTLARGEIIVDLLPKGWDK